MSCVSEQVEIWWIKRVKKCQIISMQEYYKSGWLEKMPSRSLASCMVNENVVGWAPNESMVYKSTLSASKSAIPLYVLFPPRCLRKISEQ